MLKLTLRRAALVGCSVAMSSVLLIGAAANATGETAKAPKKAAAGQTVKISAKGFPPNDSLVIVQCSAGATVGDQAACDSSTVVVVSSSSKGKVKASTTFKGGTVGDGTCNTGDTCYFVVAEPNPATTHHALTSGTLVK